ncbi:methylmalonyl-CoA mutase family protein [Bacteroidota bacterium]
MENEQNGKGFFRDRFPPVSKTAWEEKIREDLKGADYEKNLVWETHDLYRIRPYYRGEDLRDLDYLESLPGQFPYLRGSRTGDNAWLIRQDLLVRDAETSNREALEILDRGVTSIGFDLTLFGKPEESDVQTLLKNIPLERIPVNFSLKGNSLEMLGLLHGFALKNNIDPARIKGSISFDPLGELSIRGNFRKDMLSDFAELVECLEFARDNLPLFRIINTGGNIFHDSGASITQELAFTLSMGSEYLVQLTEMNFSLEEILPRIQFQFSVGSSYFMEIAKLRAARLLWSKIIQAFPSSPKDPPAMFILSMSSKWNQTLFDPHVNMLRGTTSSMSAILGGTDELNVLPFDLPLVNSNPLSGRIARNTQVILREESYLDKVIDPAAGSYYIENLTDTLISGTWDLFLQTEEKKGYYKSLLEGFIQKNIKQTADARLSYLATRRNKLLGTNRYPILDEKSGASSAKEVSPDILPEDKRILDPLRTFRGAFEFEKLRLKTENHPGKQPLVFIIPLGNMAQRRARAMYTMNFFACAGFKVVDNIGIFTTVEQGIVAARGAGADIVVLCSSDDEYPGMGPQLASLSGKEFIPVIAGYPKKHIETLKKAGIEHFINVHSNVLEELKNYQRLLGI